MDKIKVLQLRSSVGYFGAENVIVELSKQLSGTKYHPIVGVLDNSKNPHTEMADIARQNNLEIKLFKCSGQFDLRTALAIRKFIKQNNIEIVHSHGYKADFYAFFATLLLKLNLIATCHPWIRINLRGKFYAWINVILFRKFDRIIAICEEIRQELLSYGIPQNKISIVENGVETDLFSNKGGRTGLKGQLGLENRFVVSYIGTLGLAHGLSTMLQAASRLQDQYPDILFLLVGEGAEKEHLVKMANDQRLTHVRFLPQQPREKIPALIKASDVCVVMLKKAPIFKTVIPTKMLEFMACGRPVILGVDGQARQLLEAAEGGLFTEPEDLEALTDAIIKLYKDANLRNTLGHNGRRYIVKNLSRKKTSEKYLNILRSVLSTSNEGMS